MKTISAIILLFSLNSVLLSQTNCNPALIRFESSKCIEEDKLYHLNFRIVSINYKDSLTIIQTAVRYNCCMTEQGGIKLVGDTLYLYFHLSEFYRTNGKGDSIGYYIEEKCSCDCCFRFMYYINGLPRKNYVYKVDNKVIYLSEHKYIVKNPPKFDISNGDTINYIDIYEFKQGLHRDYGEFGIVSEMIYKDDEMMHGLLARTYYKNGIIKKDIYLLENRKYKEIGYNQNGKKVKECISESPFENKKDCIEFNQ